MFILLDTYNYNYIYVSKSSILSKEKKEPQQKSRSLSKKIKHPSKIHNKALLHHKRQGNGIQHKSTSKSELNSMIDDDVEMSDVSKNDEINRCMICSWEFPAEMTMNDKTIHMNYCSTGRGEEHRRNYNDATVVECVNDIPLHEESYEKCPFCNKQFMIKNVKIRMKHVSDCYRENQERSP